MFVSKNFINARDVIGSLKTVWSGRNQLVQQMLPDRLPAAVAKSRSNLLLTGKWNVKTLVKIETLGNIKRKMRTMKVHILGLWKTKLDAAGEMYLYDYRMIYS